MDVTEEFMKGYICFPTAHGSTEIVVIIIFSLFSVGTVIFEEVNLLLNQMMVGRTEPAMKVFFYSVKLMDAVGSQLHVERDRNAGTATPATHARRWKGISLKRVKK